MRISSISEQGELFNLSFDGEKRIVGWILLVTKEGKEYLIKENVSMINTWKYNIKRQMYSCDISLKNMILAKSKVEKIIEKRSGSKIFGSGIGVGIALQAVTRHIIPKNWVFGESIVSGNWLSGINNLLLLWLVIILGFKSISFYREKFFLMKLNLRFSCKLINIGKGYPLNVKKNKVNLIIKIVSVMLLIVVTLFVFIIYPLWKEYRLFSLVLALMLWVLFYAGGFYVDYKVDYLILLN